jgi:hypothetical protein
MTLLVVLMMYLGSSLAFNVCPRLQGASDGARARRAHFQMMPLESMQGKSQRTTVRCRAQVDGPEEVPAEMGKLLTAFEPFGVLPEDASRFIELSGAQTVEDVALADEETIRQIIDELNLKPFTVQKFVRAITHLKRLEAPKLQAREQLFQARELLSLFCKDPLTCGANADATFNYGQVPLVASEARATYDLLTKSNTALPGREELNRTITEWLTRRRGGFDGTRSKVPVIVNAPGTGKTTLLLRLATALEILISSDDTSEKPVVVAFTYNAEMDDSIPHELLWPDANEDQRVQRCVALRMLYGALRSMGCNGVKTWAEVLRDLQAGGWAAAIQDPAWALGILEAWFGTEREFVIAADELLKGVTERKEARTTKQIATQLYSLMGVSGRHVLLSAMDAFLIMNSGMSTYQPLFLAFGHLEYADAEPYMKTTLGMALQKMPSPRNKWKLRAIYAMSSGHARTLSKILRKVNTAATRDTRNNKRKSPLDSIHRSTLLGVASGALESPAAVPLRDVNGVLLYDDETGDLQEVPYEEVTKCTIEYALQVGRTEPKTIKGWFKQKTLSPAEDQSALKVSELISAGHAHTTAIQGVRGDVEGPTLFALDIITAHLLTCVRSYKTATLSADRFPALRLLCEALEPPIGRPLPPDDLGERCYMYAGAFALSHPKPGPREAVFPRSSVPGVGCCAQGGVGIRGGKG